MPRLLALAAWILVPLALAGCEDSTSPRDRVPPAAPRGLQSITGDHTVYLSWLPNTEGDVAGYRIYEAPCASGDDCPYDRIATTTEAQVTVSGLANGVTRYFAVAAFDHAGNESALSHENVFDTPRPEGFDVRLADATVQPSASGWDFFAQVVRPFDSDFADMYYTTSGGLDLMVTRFADTEIQDAGYATTLDAVDFAPTAGWAPSGTVELVAGHCYVLWIDGHYAKFRVSRISGGTLDMDWAFQVDPGNRELRARRAPHEGGRVRRAAALQ